MENASKALIIAGSILVAIMIVAMGVTIFNKARGSADTTSLDSAEITMFNQKFERFAGDSQSGSNVKSLISFAISNASTNKDEPLKLPTFSGVGDATGGTAATGDVKNYIDSLGMIRKKISSTGTYDVTIGYSTNGLVNTVTITQK